MGSFIIRRVAQSLIIVVMIAVTVFLVLRLSAGDPARIRAPVFARPDVIEQYRRDFGIDRPLIEQLGSFFLNALRGDLGQSFRFQAPVTDLILQALPKTLMLAGVSLALSLAVAVVLGSLAALRPRSFWGWLSSAVAAFGQSAPVFWTGAVLVLVFAVGLRWLPSGGYNGPSSLVLPAIAVTLSILPTQLRVLRASMQAVLKEDYIRTARAFGLRERRITFVYAQEASCSWWRMAAISSRLCVGEPTLPLVATAMKTLCPALAYSASVPAHCISMSSGWAPMARMFMTAPIMTVPGECGDRRACREGRSAG